MKWRQQQTKPMKPMAATKQCEFFARPERKKGDEKWNKFEWFIVKIVIHLIAHMQRVQERKETNINEKKMRGAHPFQWVAHSKYPR